jgi:hypothetical protein
MQQFFSATALSLGDWAFLVSIAIAVVFAEEVRKFFSRRLSKSAEN